jgi:hypothetical protein
MPQFYHVRSGKHFNLSNLSMTVGHTRYQLYTDGFGVLREIRDGEGHPFISEEIGLALQTFPPNEGWTIEPVGADEPEPPEEIIPVDITSTGEIIQASGTMSSRLRESIAQVKHRDTILVMYENQIEGLKATIAQQAQQIGELEREIASIPRHSEPFVTEDEDDNPPAPMIRKGRMVPPRKNVPTTLYANDSSVSTLQQAQAEVPVVNLADLDDIPRR